jgi:mannose-6-phosphate isomerase-like protein (cupin superfamily)
VTAHSVAWDTGEPIPGTPFRHLIRAADTEGRFSTQSAVLPPGKLVIPHTHHNEDEFSFVFRGSIGGRVGDEDVVVDEGGFLFKPKGIVHALWNPTDVDAIVIEFISPAGFEGFFEEMGALQAGAGREAVRDIATRYGQTPHPELVAELSELYGVSL